MNFPKYGQCAEVLGPVVNACIERMEGKKGEEGEERKERGEAEVVVEAKWECLPTVNQGQDLVARTGTFYYFSLRPLF